jgi:ABC-2 type transport system permease protein
MLALMLKDFLTQKKYFYISSLFSLAGIVFLWTNAPWIGFTWPYLMIWMGLTRGAFLQDDKNQGEAIINSLPVSKTEIVFARYLSSLAFFIYAGLIMSLFVLVLRLAGKAFGSEFPWAAIISGLLLITSIQTAITFPVYYRLGAIKANSIGVVTFMLPLPIFGLLVMLSNPERIIGAFMSFPDALKLGLTVLISTVFVGFSMLLSVRLYQTREF